MTPIEKAIEPVVRAASRGRPILDEYTDWQIDGREKRQLRCARDGRCILCGKPRDTNHQTLCLNCFSREKARLRAFYLKRKALAAIANEIEKI